MYSADSPGRLVGYIHCRTCYRRVHIDPDTFPPAPIPKGYRARLRCTKCGGRGADLRIGWSCPSNPRGRPRGLSGRIHEKLVSPARIGPPTLVG